MISISKIWKNGEKNTIFPVLKNQNLDPGVRNLNHLDLQGDLNQKVDLALNLDQDVVDHKIKSLYMELVFKFEYCDECSIIRIGIFACNVCITKWDKQVT